MHSNHGVESTNLSFRSKIDNSSILTWDMNREFRTSRTTFKEKNLLQIFCNDGTDFKKFFRQKLDPYS